MRKRPLCLLCLTFLAIKALLFLWGGPKFEKDFRASPMERVVREGEQVSLLGQVYQREQKEKYQLLYLKNNSIVHSGRSVKESHIIIYDETFLPCAMGNWIAVKGKVKYFEPARNPGNFNQKFYYQKQNIRGSIWSESITVKRKEIHQLSETLYHIRAGWKALFYHALGERDGAVLCAVFLGEKGELEPELKELYQKNGIGHILAISGLHISFLGLGLYRLLRKAGCSYGVAGAAGMAVLSLYVLMIGMGVSSIRAFLMFGLRVGANVTGRAYDMTTAAAVAALGIILWRPLYLYDAGFLLSFGAVFGIAVICPTVERLFPCKHKVTKGLCASLGINLMMFPMLLYFFFEFPIYSFFLNLLVIPLMSVLLGGAVGGSTLAFLFFPAGVWLLSGCKWILLVYEWLCRVGMQLPFARVVFGQPKWQQIVLYYCLLIVIVMLSGWVGERNRKLRVCAATLIVIMVTICGLGHGESGSVEVVALDVGQGDGIFLRGPGNVCYLIDGGSSDVSQVGKYRIEPFLKSQGVGTLQYVFVSHGDADHMNGIEEMLKRQEFGIRIGTLVLPPKQQQDESLNKLAQIAAETGTQVVEMEAGDSLVEQKMEITCMQPGANFAGEPGNESSLVLSVAYKDFDMLLTGDVEGEGEEQLTSNGKLRKYDVLKVAHHGSKNSTAESFLQQVKPTYALISAGRNNRYGHPHKETLARLKEEQSTIYTTPKLGAIEIETDGTTLSIGGVMKNIKN